MRQIACTAACVLLVASMAVSSTSARMGAPAHALVPALEISAEQGALPDASGKEVVERVCTSCHGSDILTGGEMTAPQWRETLDLMKTYGAVASDEDWKTVGDYLITNLARLSVNKASAAEIALVLAVPSNVGENVAAYRDKQGGFKTIDDLKKAPDVDAARIDAINTRLIFE